VTKNRGPALTPDDWGTLDYRQSPRALDEWARGTPEHGREDDPNENVAKLGLSDDGCVVAMNRAHDFVRVPPPARAALAAFALHEQPFGFTHVDAAALRGAAERAHAGSTRLDAELLLSLAARIEALLPPRPDPGSALEGG
jgi:hypothetical protein